MVSVMSNLRGVTLPSSSSILRLAMDDGVTATGKAAACVRCVVESEKVNDVNSIDVGLGLTRLMSFLVDAIHQKLQ